MIVFSDMDGTFLDSKKRISARNRKALDALNAARMDFVPCTGRAMDGLPAELLAHPAVRYAICANGASVYEVDGAKVLHRICLGPERAAALLELARGRDVTFDIFADGRCYTARTAYDRLGEFVSEPFMLQGMIASRTPVDEPLDHVIRNVKALERIAMYWRDPRDRDELESLIARDPSVSMVRSYDNNIEVSDCHATKGASMAWLCEHVGVSLDEAIAFGDNINDISMIEAAGCGVAMANAEPEVLACADMTAPSNDEDGVGAVILQKLAEL